MADQSNTDTSPAMIATIRKAGRELGEAFAKLGAAITESFARDEDTPPEQLHGPRPRHHRAQHRTPRLHRTNTVLTAHSRRRPAPSGARRRGYRTGGAGR